MDTLSILVSSAAFYLAVGLTLGLIGQINAPRSERAFGGFLNVVFLWPYTAYLIAMMLVYDLDVGPHENISNTPRR